MLDASAKQGILKPIRLVLVDRQPIVLQGLKSILGTQQDFDVVASISDGTSCLEAIRNLSPDVAVIADNLPDLTASDILVVAQAEKFPTRLVFFTESDTDPDLTAAVAAGACSAISKYAAPGPMLRSLRQMAKSGVSLEQSDLAPAGKEADGGGKIDKMLDLLTPRERQIVRLVSEGMSNKEIARQLDLSQGTVKVHLHNIFQKLEITNRTVLATISLLQRTSGFSALALAFLAFAIADELKAADASDMFAHDDGPDQTDEHAGFEIWKKAILQHLIVSKSGGTPAFAERDFFAKASQATNPAAAMEALRAAEQLLGLRPWKDGAAVGSGTASLPAPLLPGPNGNPTGGGPAAEDHLPRLAFPPTSIPGGYGTFAAVAGALIYALNDPGLAAQARELDQASIDSFLTGTGDDATTKLAAIKDVDAGRAENSAPHFLSRDFGGPSGLVTGSDNIAHQGVQGQTAQGTAVDNGQKVDGVLDPGHLSGPGGDGRDQLMGGSVENAVHHSPPDSKSSSSDSVLDVASGPGRLNLAAFGALAWLHLTAATKSIPPHTLAWIYDPASNQTIVYVNPTDHILEIGDRGLLEIHLQGIVTVAEAEGVAPQDGVAVTFTLEQLEQALISATATDEAVSSADNIHASESALAAAGVWSASAGDGLSFQFTKVRTGAATSAKSSASTRDSADTTEESAGASGLPASGSWPAPGHGAPPAAVEDLTSKSGPANPNNGAQSTTQNEIVPLGLETADSTGRGNSEHASDQGSAKAAEMAEAKSKSDDGDGNDNGHHSQAADGSSAAAKAPESGGAEHSNSGHSASAKETDAGESVATDDSTDHGKPQHAAEPEPAKTAATEMAEAKSKSDDGAGNDNEHHFQAADGSSAAAKAPESGGAEHGNSGHSASAEEADAGESVATNDSTIHGKPQHAAEPEPAKTAATEMAEAKSKSDDGDGNDNEHHSQAADGSSAAAKAPESGGAEHGNSGHSASAKETDAGESVATNDSTDHGKPQHAAEPEPAKTAATEMAEAKSKSDDGAGNDNEHHSQAADGSSAAAKAPESGGAKHGNSGHSASAKEVDAGESVATNDSTDHGKPQHAAEPEPAKTPATEMAEAKSKPDNGAGKDSEYHSQALDGPQGAAKTAEPGGTDHSNPGHSASAKETDAGESVATDDTEQGRPQHAAEPVPAKPAAMEMAGARVKLDSAAADDNEHHRQASSDAPGAAESGSAEHGNSRHSASAKEADAGESVATNDSTDHGKPQHAAEPEPAKTPATEMAEAKSKPDSGDGNDNEHHSQALDGPRGAAKTSEPGGADHSNPGHSAAGKGAEAGESVANVDTEQGRPQHAAEPVPAKPAAMEMAGAKFKLDSGAADDNEHHSQASSDAPGAAESGSAEHGNSGHSASAKEVDAGESVATNDSTDHSKPQQDAHSGANASLAAQPAKAASELWGTDQDPVFRFDGEAPAATLVEFAEPQELHNPHAALGQEGLRTIVEMVPHVPDEHAPQQGHHGPHPGILHGPHDLLI
ncbi:response regulator [Bradyrhizobium frederickii]|uniref:Response regulator n=1 Tax=Bradyrhizobium frederickii TaxID=2560054 RepID=A0A4Y9L3M7_9BRAD|nr:LuxR C-terminal-related transcriptional regulator [Bradyrhizobium frederickii]TFV38015.1 response regulator [Bradyrhizobium frederickii]